MTSPVLSYCLNVHPAETLDEVVALLEGPVARARAAWRGEARMGVGLWLPLAAARAIAEDDGAAARVKGALSAAGLFAYTVNAFPIGGFHRERVKETVYRPTWLEGARADYTRLACRALARLLPEGARGSVSTVPISWRGFGDGDAAGLARAGANLGGLAADLLVIEDATGHEVSLALEPEPRCTLETTVEAADFLEAHVFSGAGRAALVARGHTPARAEAALRRFVGVCVDTCHLACVFEPLGPALDALARRGVRVPKAQLSAAPELPRPAENDAGRVRLAAFAEPRYLHQTFGREASGQVTGVEDLGLALDLALDAGARLAPAFARAERLRTHFHVPLCWPGEAALGTTRGELEGGLEALARATDHLEVETYTFAVLPDGFASDVVTMVVDELRWADAALRATGVTPR